MSGDIQFNPQSWQQAAERLGAQAEALSSAWQSASGAVGDPAACGCNNGGTLADAALAIVLPAMLDAVNQTVTGIANGLTNEALATGVTGIEYLNTEADNDSLAGSVEV